MAARDFASSGSWFCTCCYVSLHQGVLVDSRSDLSESAMAPTAQFLNTFTHVEVEMHAVPVDTFLPPIS